MEFCFRCLSGCLWKANDKSKKGGYIIMPRSDFWGLGGPHRWTLSSVEIYFTPQNMGAFWASVGVNAVCGRRKLDLWQTPEHPVVPEWSQWQTKAPFHQSPACEDQWVYWTLLQSTGECGLLQEYPWQPNSWVAPKYHTIVGGNFMEATVESCFSLEVLLVCSLASPNLFCGWEREYELGSQARVSSPGSITPGSITAT